PLMGGMFIFTDDPFAKHPGPAGQHNMYRWSQSPERWTYYSGGPDGDMDNAREKGAAGVQAASLKRLDWGPLIGNPQDPNLAGLQYSMADDKFFWQGINAPRWATQGADLKITE